MNAAKVVEDLKQRFPNEPEYIQAVSQVLPTIEEEYNKHPEFHTNIYRRWYLRFDCQWRLARAGSYPYR